MKMLEVHRALADALGIDYRGRRVTGFDVRCRHDELPTVTVHELVSPRAGTICSSEHRLQLVKAFDLDRMCADAMQRVQTFIDERAAACLLQLKAR
jgi:hypothetical protein